MKFSFKTSLVTLGLFMLAGCFLVERAGAAVITQWSFPASVSQGTTATTNSPPPTYGSGTAVTLGMTNNYNGGNVAGDDVTNTAGLGAVPFTENAWRIRGDGGQKTNPVGGNGWALYNSGGPGSANGAPEYSQGIQLDASTVGYSNVSFSFDWYSTTQGIRDLQFQYCLNATNSAASGYNNWINMNSVLAAATSVPDGLAPIQTSNTAGYTLTGSTISQAGAYVFVATANDWYGGQGVTPTISVNLSSVAGAANDPYLGIRLVSAFDDTGNLNDYAAATLAGGKTQLYNNSSGNWRFGDLTFAGNVSLSTNYSGPTLTWMVGSGTWDTVTANWNDGSGPATYSDPNISIASFGAVSSGTSTINVQSGGVTPTGITISNSNANTGYTFVGGAIGGTGALYMTPTNVGFVSLSGTNTYTGGTQVSGGTLIVAGDSSLGVAGNSAAGAVVLDGGATLQLASALTSGRLLEIGNSVGNGGGVFNTNGLSASTSGNVLSSGNFLITGGGTLALNGFSTQLSAATAVDYNTTLILGGTNVAAFQGGGTFNGNVLVNGPERVNFDNAIYNGSGAIEVTYSGSIVAATSAANSVGNAANIWSVISNTSSGSSTATGGYVTSGGTIANNIVLNPNNLPFTKSNVGGTAVSTNGKSTTYTFVLPSSNYFIAGIGATTPGNTLTISGNISGQSDVVLGSNSNVGSGGAGTLYLSGSNSWTGTTMIDGNNVVQLGSSNALPAATDVIFGVNDKTAATLDLNGNNATINTLSVYSGSPIVTNSRLSNSATLTITSGTTSANPYSGVISGNLAIVKNGAGTLTLTGSDTYTGNTNLNSGLTVISGTSALGTGAVTVASGGTLQTSGAAVVLANSLATLKSGAAFNINGGTAYGAVSVNNLTLAGSNSIYFATTTTQDDLISGTGALNLNGSQIVVDLSQTGTIFNSYPLFEFGSVTGFSSSSFGVGSGTSSKYNYSFQDNNGTISLIISGSSGSVAVPAYQSLAWSTSSGSWNSTATNWNPSPTAYVDGDSVTFGEPTANGSLITITSGGVTPASLTISNSSNTYTFTGGPILGTTSLNVVGSSLVTLSNTSSYTGGTFVSGGTLQVTTGDLAVGNKSGAVTISSGATFETTTTAFTAASNPFTIGPGAGTINTGGLLDTLGATFVINPSSTLTVTGGGTLAIALSAKSSALTAGAGSLISVLPNTNLSILADSITSASSGTANNIAFNIATGANVFLTSAIAGTAASTVFEQAYGGTYNGNLVVQNPLTLSFASGTYSGSGAIQFQSASMVTPAAETHFSAASGALIEPDNVNTAVGYSQTIGVNIELDSDNKPFYRTSISQSGAGTGGTGFILGQGTASVLYIDANSPAGFPNTLTISGVISGSGDVQFGPIGGGGQGGTVILGAQNTYTGVTMLEFGVGGTVQLATSNALPTTTDLMFAPVSGNSYQANIDLNGNNQTFNSISYWAYGSAANEGIVNSDVGTVATLTVSGATTPARPFTGVLNDLGGELALVKAGSNALILTGSNSGYSGGTTVQGGLLLIAPGGANLNPAGNALGIGAVSITGGTLQGTGQIGSQFENTANASLNVYAGGTVHPGLANIPSYIPSLALASAIFPAQVPGTLSVLGSAGFSAGSNLIFDFASSSSQSLITVGGNLGLPTSGTITLTIGTSSGLALGTPVPLIEYDGSLANGNSISSIGSLFKVANATSYFPDYTLTVTGTNAGYIDLTEVRNRPLWTGSSGSVWSNTAPNFSSGGSPTPFYNGDAVTFADSASTGLISISGSVAPSSVTFSNSAEAYTLTGGAITGTGGLYVNGNGVVTLANTNTYTGETNVSSGTLVLDGAASLLAGNSLFIGSGAGGVPFAALPSAGGSPVSPPSSQGGASLAPVPEPGTFMLLAVAALGGIGLVRRKRKSTQVAS